MADTMRLTRTKMAPLSLLSKLAKSRIIFCRDVQLHRRQSQHCLLYRRKYDAQNYLRNYFHSISTLATSSSSSSAQSSNILLQHHKLIEKSRTFTSRSATEPTRLNEVTNFSMESRTAFGLLKLSKFTKSEIDWRYDRIIQAGSRFRRGHKSNEASGIQVETSSQYSANTKKDEDTSQQIRLMRLEDLEAYLFERYLYMEDRWNGQSHRLWSNTRNNLELNEEENPTVQVNRQLNEAFKVHENQRRRIEKIRDHARNDATSIFRLLMPHITSSRNDDSISSIQQPATTVAFSKEQFHSSLDTLSSQIHYPTILPLAASMLLVGSSVGVISPIMPFLATELQLTTTHYGIVVSSFALSKMIGNVPSAILVERHGRKPYSVHSLWLVGLGVAGLGLSTDWIQLSACRMTIGLGVAALTTASTLMVADVSTPLSRASTFSPIMSAFAGGTALGPALGGILCDHLGIRETFLMVGASYGAVAFWNSVSLRETGRKGFWEEGEKLPWHNEEDDVSEGNRKSNMNTTVLEALKDTRDQWSSLTGDPKVRPIVIMNGFYLCALSGTQMTLLPLLLTNGGAASGAATGLALSATAMGQVYMWMSAVQVLGNPVSGRFADKAGKHTAIIAGGLMTSVAMATVPLICSYGVMVSDLTSLDANNVNWPLLAAALGIWSFGGTLLATSHVAAVSDAVSDSRRSQAIALLRTAGDVGFLCGAAGAGIAADMMGDVGYAMQAGSAVLIGATVWFGLQHVVTPTSETGTKEQTRQ